MYLLCSGTAEEKGKGKIVSETPILAASGVKWDATDEERDV